MKSLLILAALASFSAFACDNHPGMTHDQYVISIRKRYETPAPTDSYSTAITEDAAPADPPQNSEDVAPSQQTDN
ncbi:MAG: hypothetical protein H6617_10440 [Bdellovibrionaceae bacterium]|nr:hypothetical protein [Bdellovibrionales bacterium]MCB9255088.1 hypothetical protein [Pseudobdellovibrionaceae bacterium]